MKILGICFFFLFNLSLCAQQDSGYVSHQYYMKYEHLKEIGRYEKAAIALGKAFEYRGLTNLEYHKNSELKKISKLVKNELSDSIKYANRIEWAQTALDSAALYNWSSSEQYVKSCYISSADYFYKEAQIFISKPHHIQKIIHAEINSLPVDTIYSFNPLSVFSVFIATADQYKNPHGHLYAITKEDTILTVRDSTPFSGIFMNGINPHDKSVTSFSQNYWRVEEGIVVDQTKHSHLRFLIYDNEGNSNLHHFINRIHKEKEEERYSLNYRGDTTFSSRKFVQNNVIIEDYVKYGIPRDTANYSRTEFFPDSIVSFSYQMGDDNDTLEYSFDINKKKRAYNGSQLMITKINQVLKRFE